MRLGRSWHQGHCRLGISRKTPLKSALLGTLLLCAATASAASAGEPSQKEASRIEVGRFEPGLPGAAAPIGYAGVCDSYGNGFFYLPGTETCFKIGGLIYGEVQVAAPNYSVNGQTFEGNGTPANGGYVPTRSQYATAGQRNAVGYLNLGRLELDARKETPYGVVRVFVRGDTLFGSRDSGLASGIPGSVYAPSIRDTTVLNKAFLQFNGLTAGFAQSMFDFYADADNWGYLRGSNATVPLLAYTASFGQGFSATLSLEDERWRRAAIGSTVANFQAAPTSSQAPDIVGNIRLDQPWGALQLSGAAHQIHSNLYPMLPNGTLGASVNAKSDFGMAVQGGLELNTDMISPGDKLWLQAAFEKGATSYTNGNNLASDYAPSSGPRLYGTGVSPQDYNFGWDPQLPMDCVYTGVSALSATCEKPWGFSFTGVFKHNWTPDLSSSVFGSYLTTSYDPNALAGLGGAVGVVDTKETRIGGSLVWTPIKGLDIGTEFMYLHLSQSTPAGLAPNYGSTSLNASGVPSFKANNNEYEGRIRVQKEF